MSSVATLIFNCISCSHLAIANPLLVPSIPVSWDRTARQWVSDPKGTRQPICRSCAEKLAERVRAGECQADPASITPEYFDRAYRTGADEKDL